MKTFLACLSLGRTLDNSLNISRAIGSTVARQVLSGVLQFIALWVVARDLGAARNGMLATAMLLPLALHAILNLGLGAGHAYYVSKGNADVHKMRKVNWTLAAVIWTLVAAALLACNEEAIRKFLPGVTKELALTGAVLLPVMLLANWSSSLVQGSRDYDRYNKLLLVHPAVFCGAILVLHVLEKITIASVLASYIASYLVFWLLSEWRTKALASSVSAASHSGFDSIRFGLKAHLSNVITFLNYRIDLYLVSLLAGATQTGQYSLSIELAERLWLISYAASVVVFPEAAARQAQPRELRMMTGRVARTVLIITGTGAVVAAVLAPYVIPGLFGPDYQGAVLPFVITLPGIVLWSYMRILANTLAGLGMMRVNNWSACLCLVINVAGNLIAIPVFGATGAALATTLAYSFAALYTAAMYKKVMDKKVDELQPGASHA